MSLVVSVTPVKSEAAEKGIFLNASSAKRIVIDLRYCNEKLPLALQELGICDRQVENLNKQAQNLNLTLSGMRLDNAALEKTKDEYKDKYVKTNDALIKEQESKPSRLTWFGTGFISALLVGIAMAIAIK
jgi:hypothetical protein